LGNYFLNIDNVSKSYNKTKALTSIKLDIEQGELFGFIGPDGAGKTTLFRIIATLLLPDEGRVSILGLDVVENYKTLRRMLGYMPGRFSLYYDLSVIENLRFYATIFGTSLEENYDIIKDVYIQIEPFKNRLARKLSGGMKQKLALCCALIHKPELLIVDEPTTGVDAVSRKEFWEMLQKLKKSGITIIVSTPYMDEAIRCDRVALMQEGSLMQVATPQNIVNNFDYNLYGLRASNLYKLLKIMRKYSNTKSVNLFGQELHLILVDDSKTELQKLNELLRQNDFYNISIKRIDPDIEDCFMDLMIE